MASTIITRVRSASSLNPAAGKLYRSSTSPVFLAEPDPLLAAPIFSTSDTVPSSVSWACLATAARIFALSGRSHASTWVSDTISSPSAMVTTRNEANVSS